MSKDNNQFGIDHAFPGLCSLCHKEIAEFAGSQEVAPGVYRPIVSRLLPSFRSKLVYLSDGSQMSVSLCDKCDASLTPEDCSKLMESEIKGWNKEVEIIQAETEKKEAYKTKMSKLFIEDVPSKAWTKEQKDKISKPKGVDYGTGK